MNWQTIFIGIGLTFWLSNSQAQSGQLNVKDSLVDGVLIEMHGGLFLGAADFWDRFGFTSTSGIGVRYKLKTLQFGLQGSFHFSNNVKEDSFMDGLTTIEGTIIDANGNLQTLGTQLRGFSFFGTFGKTWETGRSNANSGWLTDLGIGFFQHKIRYNLTNKTIPPQLQPDLVKGYDRLSNGLAFYQNLGYHVLGSRRMINFNISLYLMQAFTKNRRDLNFDTGTRETDTRIDILYGLRAAWILPIYNRGKRHMF